MNSIAKNINDIRKRIENTSNGKKVTLIAVTKTFSADCAKQAIDIGISDIAESKIQEAIPKFEALSNSLNGINKHFIGHLQSNKAKKAVLNFDLIQSLDSIDLAKDINRHAKDIGKVQKCLIELKVSTEATKSGASKEKVNEIYDYCVANCPNVLICGIMTIAPYFDDKELVRPYFKLAYNVFENIKKIKNDGNFNILSMGMSDDFEIAIQEGSNMVRVGTAIFGERNYDK
ncbi:MAG: YggS family pyridoxal phosphate-dependent enzyme [Elusimicrobia bacterium]|nr:YggS family pyridoxal phosphate-dependent enzyme [Elusimicrobiota bacterium]MBR4633054.1 YggS family pyridoxal phosphate-dependent enzyme [Elusimicrobiota bacterium]